MLYVAWAFYLFDVPDTPNPYAADVGLSARSFLSCLISPAIEFHSKGTARPPTMLTVLTQNPPFTFGNVVPTCKESSRAVAWLLTGGRRRPVAQPSIRPADYRRRTLPFRGVKGTTGTQASFLEIFEGDHEKVRRLDHLVTEKMSFPAPLAVTGQTYTRKLDAFVLGVVAGIAASAAKFSGDIRMLQSFGEIEEPFESEQIGSSAMAYKRNPIRAERIASLARFVNSLEGNANQTHAVQYFERTLDDSANRRLVIPEMFLATDAILVLMANIARGLEVHSAVIERRIASELPFMATEQLIVRAVRAGGDRQVAHETIRKHSLAAARALKDGAEENDLLDRLAADKSFGVKLKDLEGVLDAKRFVGRAPEQVDDFLRDVITPLFAGETASSERTEDLKV